MITAPNSLLNTNVISSGFLIFMSLVTVPETIAKGSSSSLLVLKRRIEKNAYAKFLAGKMLCYMGEVQLVNLGKLSL